MLYEFETKKKEDCLLSVEEIEDLLLYEYEIYSTHINNFNKKHAKADCFWFDILT